MLSPTNVLLSFTHTESPRIAMFDRKKITHGRKILIILSKKKKKKRGRGDYGLQINITYFTLKRHLCTHYLTIFEQNKQ